MREIIAEIKGLTIQDQQRTLVSDVNLTCYQEECLGIVGESGSGKTLTMKSLLGLLPNNLKVEAKCITLLDVDIQQISYQKKSQLLGRKVGFIPQNTVAYLHPLMKIKDQLIDGVLTHFPYTKKEALSKAIQLLEEVGLQDCQRVLHSFPSQLSGGMRQRVNIAMALMNDPEVLIADEPTTALDVLVQKQVLQLFKTICQNRRLTMILISHDLQAIESCCDRIAIMYAGQIVEVADKKVIFNRALHPYTKALIQTSQHSSTKGRLKEIPGYVPEDNRQSRQCLFKQRCDCKLASCEEDVQCWQTERQFVRCTLVKGENK